MLGCVRAAELHNINLVKTSSAGMVRPEAGVNQLWAAPNKLTANATLEKLKSEDGPAWLDALGMPSAEVIKRVAQEQGHLDRGLARSIVYRGETRKKVIALTFDDGPHPAYTLRLLAELHSLNVAATFFVVGRQVEKYPDLLRAIYDGGYEIGNHTYDHCSLIKVPPSYVPTELIACGSAVRAVTGISPHLFRPPGGEFDKTVAEEAEELGYQTVLWTDDPGDFAKPPADVILRRTLARAAPGGIILLHDGIEQTMSVLPQLVATLRQQGYEFVTMDELIRQRAADGRSFGGQGNAGRLQLTEKWNKAADQPAAARVQKRDWSTMTRPDVPLGLNRIGGAGSDFPKE